MQAFLETVSELKAPDRRAFLYSDLGRQKLDNPDGFAEAIAFWTRLLAQAMQERLLSTSTFTIDTHNLASRLVFRGDTPMGLDAVLAELLASGRLCGADDYFARPLQRWASWLARLVVSKSYPLRVVDTVAVRDAAARILAAHAARVQCPLTDNVMSLGDFCQTFGMTKFDAHV
ncbi:hypothetical protein IWW38_006312, partial [Coemansia aciculifera]